MTPARATTRLAALVAGLALAGCPAPAVDDNPFEYDVVPFDATPIDPTRLPPSNAPSCSPERVIDMNARGQRDGARLRIRVDTRNARNDLRSSCVVYDSGEVVLRYTTPPRAVRNVVGIRVTTITDATLANLGAPPDQQRLDPTDYDTVIGIRLGCERRETSCSNDGFFRDARGQASRTRRSTAYHVGLTPEETVYIVVDGANGAVGTAEVLLEEYTELGQLYTPCVPVPPERAADPTAPTAYFRCPRPGIRCQPGAGADGTDLCVPIVPLGMRCDRDLRFDTCEREIEGAECVANPSAPEEIRCAMPGTAPGARCRGLRTSLDRCDPGLVCSPGEFATDRDVCIPLRNEGFTCDPGGHINRCAAGLECCGEAPDAGATYYCRRAGGTCHRPPPG